MSQDGEQLRDLIRKYEQRQRDLEERELQARDRLTMLETYMPAVLSWNAWSALQAQQVTPGEVTRIITGQQLLPMDESYTRRLQELENVVRGIKGADEVESLGLKPSESLTPDDLENMKKLQEIATNEMQLKRRIQSMERKELMYLAALQKADELRMRAEGITSGQEYTSPTIVEAGSSAEGLQRRVMELEAEVNRLTKKSEVLEAENEKLLHMISDGAQEDECTCAVEGLPQFPSVPQPAGVAAAPKVPEAPAAAQMTEEPPGAEVAVAVQELQPEATEAAEPVVTEAAEPVVTEAAEPAVTRAAEPEVSEAAGVAAELPAEAPQVSVPPSVPQEAGAEGEEPVCSCMESEADISAPPAGEAAQPAAEGAPPPAEAAVAPPPPPPPPAAAAPPTTKFDEFDYGPRCDHVTDCDTEIDEYQEVPEHIKKAMAEEEAALYAKAFPPVLPVITRSSPGAPSAGPTAPAAAEAPAVAAEPAAAEVPAVAAVEPAMIGRPGASAEERVAELEAEINRLRKLAEDLRAENEKLQRMIAEGGQGGECTCELEGVPGVCPSMLYPPGVTEAPKGLEAVVAVPAAAEEPQVAEAAEPVVTEAVGGAAEVPAEAAQVSVEPSAPEEGGAEDSCICSAQETETKEEPICSCVSGIEMAAPPEGEAAPSAAEAAPPTAEVAPTVTEAAPPPAAAAPPTAEAAPPTGKFDDVDYGPRCDHVTDCDTEIDEYQEVPEHIKKAIAEEEAALYAKAFPPVLPVITRSSPGAPSAGPTETTAAEEPAVVAAAPEAPLAAPEGAPAVAAPEAVAPATPVGAPEEIAVGTPTAAPAAAAGAGDSLDQLIEMTKALQAAFEHIRGCPSCFSTIGPTLEGIIDTLGRITSTLTAAHGGAPGTVATPFSPVTAGVEDMFPSAPVFDEAECKPFNVVTSDPECGILCWRDSHDFIDAQGEVPEPREYANSDPNCAILCWDDISFEKVKQMPLAVKPPELESKGLEEGKVLTVVALGPATTEPLSVSADIKVTSGPAVIAIVERSSQESFEYSEECYSRVTAEDFPFGEQGSFALEQGKLCKFTDSELELPFEEDAESVHLHPQERLFQNEFPECLSQATAVKELKPIQQLTTVVDKHIPLVQVAPEKAVVQGIGKVAATTGKRVCKCSGVCTCSRKRPSPVKKEVPLPKEKPSEESLAESLYTRTSAEDFFFGDSGSFVFELSKLCEFTDSELELPFEEEAESVYLGSSERLFKDEFPDKANLLPLIVKPHGVMELTPTTAEVPTGTGITAFDDKVSELSPAQMLGEEKTAAAGCICSGVCTCSSSGIEPIKKLFPVVKEKVSEDSVTESSYSRTSAEDFYFGDPGSFTFELSKLCKFTDSELELPFEEEVESVYLGSSERLFKDEFPESANLSPFIVQPHGVTPTTAEAPTTIGVIDFGEEVSTVSPVQVTAEEKVSATTGKAVCICCKCSVCKCSSTETEPATKEVPLTKEKVSEESVTESLYSRTSAEDFYFGDPGSFAFELSKPCKFTDSELELPFEEEVESVYIGSSERLFKDEFPESANLPPLIVQPRGVMELIPTTAEVLTTTGIATFDEKVSELSPIQVQEEENVKQRVCTCAGVCTCASERTAPVTKELPLAEGKLSDGSCTESVYTRISAEDFYFGEFGSYILIQPPKICEFTDSELELPFEEEVESVYLGSTERLFKDEFPESSKLAPYTMKPVAITAETAGGYRIERTTSSTGQLRDEIYYDVPERKVMEPYVADILGPLESIKKKEDEIMSEIPGILTELLARCEGGPEGKPELSEVQDVLTEILAKCAAVGADKQAVMQSVIAEVITKGGEGSEEVNDILKDLIGKCGGTVPGTITIPDIGLLQEVVAGGAGAPDVQDILADILKKCGSTGKMEASDVSRIISGLIPPQVGIQPQFGVPEQPVIPQTLELLPEGVIVREEQEIKQKRVCTCASSPERPVEETKPEAGIVPVQEGKAEHEAGEGIGKQTTVSAAEGPFAYEELVLPVATVRGSDASFEYNEDSYSRITVADFPFGQSGSCVLESPKEYRFTDSELELPFEEEEPFVELGPEERLFQNEFTGAVTATYKPLAVTIDTAEETSIPEEVTVTVGAPVTAGEQEEETFFEAVGETLPQEKIIEETICADERREGEGEGDLETQLASLQQRMSNKSKDIIEIKTLLSQLHQQQTRLEGKLGVEPSQFPEVVMVEEDYTKAFAVAPGTRPSASELQAAIASLQDKCRVKDHMIGAMVEELRARAQSGIWNELKSRIAAAEMPQPDYTRSQVVEYLTPEAQFPQLILESTGPCACSGDAKPTSMAVSVPPVREERACVASPPSPQAPVSTCTCPGDFKIVRKIGVDSLLLGWQVPATSANLSGYDIYVNGVLQCKVWSGTRNRALLHCLDLSSPMVILLYGRTTSGQLSGPARITYSGGA